MKMIAWGLACLILSTIGGEAQLNNNPVRMIFDTDIGNDIDDALALGMIHSLADRGEVELLAVTVCKDNPWAAVYVDLVNHFYGRPDVPIGAVRKGITPEDGNYIRAVAERKVNGKFVYPRHLKSGEDAPEAVSLLRRTLAAQPDGSVVMVSVGFMTNFARFLDSKPDDISPLDGRELARRKVKMYSMMAGDFSAERRSEYNAAMDLDATRKVFENWPTPLVVSGFEVGLAITYPAVSIERDFGYVESHPVAEAYRLYMQMPYDRPTWDLTSALYAVRPDRGYFGLPAKGKIILDSSGRTTFSEASDGQRQYLTITPEQIARAKEAFTWLVSAPPLNLKSGRQTDER